jgi:hypothetical protein
MKVIPGWHQSPIAEHLRIANFEADCVIGRYSSLDLEEVSWEIDDIDTWHMALRLVGCDTLKHLSCRWQGGGKSQAIQLGEWGYPDECRALPNLHRCLDTYFDSLERLTLDADDSGWLTDKEEEIPAIGSLRDFTSLKHIDVSGLVLFGHYTTSDSPDLRLSRILPASLETLNIKAVWDGSIEAALCALLPECSTFLPNLQKIECSWTPASKTVAEYLVAAFSKQGVGLVLEVSTS